MRKLHKILFLIVLEYKAYALNPKKIIFDIFDKQLTSLKESRFTSSPTFFVQFLKILPHLINASMPKIGVYGVKIILIKSVA